MVMKIQVIVLWVVMPCSGVMANKCFGGLCCLKKEAKGSSKILISYQIPSQHH